MRLSRENRKSVRYLIIEHLVINCNKLLWDNLQLSCVCVFVRVDGWTVSVPEPEYSVQGYASATMSHAAAHKARYLMFQNKLTFIP